MSVQIRGCRVCGGRLTQGRLFCSHSCYWTDLRKRQDPATRFIEFLPYHLVHNYPDACWEWQGGTKGDYGQFWLNGRNIGAHVAAWQLFVGEIPVGLCVLHRCDNPPCANPAHLFLGTHADNSRDMSAKGRGGRAAGDRHGSRTHPERVLRGEQKVQAKLTAVDVGSIRARYELGGVLQRELAAEFGVDPALISRVVRGLAWR